MRIGIDQSKRCTAIVALTEDGALDSYRIISALELEDEELITYQWNSIRDFIYNVSPSEDIKEIGIEGLSFNSVSSSKDLLAGLFWYLRVSFLEHFKWYPVRIVPVLTWRSKVIDKEERKTIASLKDKAAIKKATVDKLPFEVKVKFEDYVRTGEFNKAAIYDLTDAYFIALHLINNQSSRSTTYQRNELNATFEL